MDDYFKSHLLTCRLCLCKCENPRNMLVDTQFASKVMHVFPKIQISTENNLSNLVCDYCHNLIEQFYGYFESVNTNQDELMKQVASVQKEEIFAVPIGCVEEKSDNFTQAMKSEVKVVFSDDETGWFDQDSLINESYEITEASNVSEPRKTKRPRGRPRKVDQGPLTKKELMKLNYFELIKLPKNFTSSFVCPVCPKKDSKRFQTKLQLSSHIEAHHEDFQYESKNLDPKCDICFKTLGRTNQLNDDHKFVHYNIKPYICDHCGFTSHTKATLWRHITKHEFQIKCAYCFVLFSTRDLQQQHIREKHSNKMLTCDWCGERFFNKHSLRRHFAEHLSELLTLECDRCLGGIRFADKRILALHLEQHAKEDKSRKRMACHLCEQKFYNEHSLNKHLRLHAQGKIISCHICGKSIKNDPSSKHILIHTKTQLIKCTECDEEFKTQNALTRHLSRVHFPNKQSCYRCGKIYPEDYMERHLKFCHSGELKCTHCPMTFSKESARQLHNNKFHTGFKCKRCNIIFENRTQMDHHQRYDEYHVSTKSRKNIVHKKINRTKMFKK